MTTGYKTVTPTQLGNLLHAVQSGAIAWSGARVWFACLEMVAIREAVRRMRRKCRRSKATVPDYTLDEVVLRTDLAPRVARRALLQLRRLGLVTFASCAIDLDAAPIPEAQTLIAEVSGARSPNRPIPLPRRLIRHLAAGSDATFGRVMLGYVLRGLSISRRGGEVRSAGTVKAVWLASVLGLGLRTVKGAQARLRQLGWIPKDVGSRQWKLNRDGAWFRIDTGWQSPVADTEAAPRFVENGTPAAPLKENRKTPSESKDQKTPPGACTRPVPDLAPTLHDIQLTDLRSPARLQALRAQAVARGWIRDCPADSLNFFAAAVRARSTPARDPVRVFVSLVRNRSWGHVTQCQEGEARRMLQSEFVARERADALPGRLGEILPSLLASMESRIHACRFQTPEATAGILQHPPRTP